MKRDAMSAHTDQPSLRDFDWLFHHQHQHRRTPLTHAFFSFGNLTAITVQIERNVRAKMNHTQCAVIPRTIDFFWYISEVIVMSPDQFDVTVIPSLNELVTSHEVVLRCNELQQRSLFDKWVIQKEYPRIIDYPRLSHGRRQTTPLDPNTYILHNPTRNAHSDFRTYTMGIKNNQ